MEELKKKIDNFIITSGTKSFRWLYKEINESKELLDILHANIDNSLLDKQIAQKLYHFYYQIKEIPKCRQCGKEIIFMTFSRAYCEFCDRKCSSLYQSINKDISIEKRKKTVKEKYGVDFVMQSDIVKKTYIENSIEKYGVDWVSKSDEVKKSITETWANKEDKKEIDDKRYTNLVKSIRKKYNDDTLTSVFGLDYVIEKKKQTCLENNGVLYPFQSEIIRDRYKKTCKDKYGYENAMHNDIIQRKQFVSAFKLKRYILPSGEEVKIQGDSDIILPLLLEKYKESDINIEFACDKIEYYLNNNKHYYRPDFHIKSENKVIEVKSVYYLIKEFNKNIAKFNYTLNTGYELELYLTNHQKDIIIFDFKDTKISIFLKELGLVNIIYGTNCILIPENKIIINIIDINKDCPKNYLKKLNHNFNLSNNSNIRVINIFSDLIENKFDIIKSRLLNLLNKSNSIYARKCTIKEIDKNLSKKFLMYSHIQGNTTSSINIGLYYKDNIVAIMTFGKNRLALGKKSIDGEFELLRFSSILGYNIIGGASKLLSYFIKTYKPNKITSYADLNWSTGNLYYKLGFNKIHESVPNYWWCKDNIRHHRFVFRKDKLVSMGYDKNKTEIVIMIENGYKQVFDCGNIKFEMTFD